MKFLRMGDPGEEAPFVIDSSGHTRALRPLFEDLDAHFLSNLTQGNITEDVLGTLPIVEPPTSRIGAPLPRPGKIVCIGLNYSDHAEESGMPIPEEPIVFMKDPLTVVGPHDPIHIPQNSHKTDWEVELGVVIGAQCRYLKDEHEASQNIAGFVVSNDVSEREFQLERGGQWDKGKSCETFNPCGPWLVPPSQDFHPGNLDMWLDVNGVEKQRGNTSNMIFSVSYVVWYLSQFMVLAPGDIINTGTPPGVGLGMKPPEFLVPGDVVTLGIEGLGTQQSMVIAAP